VANGGSHSDRAARLLASPRVRRVIPPRDVAWPIPHPEPPDLAALYAVCDGLELEDGVRLFGRGELDDVTKWLVLEKGLLWPTDFVVVGERRDVVVVLDLDVGGTRAGGGVLEVASDDLGSFERAASSVVSYLLVRSGAGDDLFPPSEMAARTAAGAGDRVALERELSRPMYPGQDRLFAALAIELGALLAEAGERDRALSTFERSVEARMRSVGRGGRSAEGAAAWRAAAHASRARGAEDVALACEKRAAAVDRAVSEIGRGNGERDRR